MNDEKDERYLATNSKGTHGIIRIKTWDGESFFVKEFKTSKIRHKSETIEVARKILAEQYE